MIRSLTLTLYIGFKSLLSKFSEYDLSYRAKMFFAFLFSLNLILLGSLGLTVFDKVNIINTKDVIFYCVLFLIILVVYFYISELARNQIAVKRINIKQAKRLALIWIAFTFLILIPSTAIILILVSEQA